MEQKEQLTETITLPEGVTASLQDEHLQVKGEKGEITRKLSHPLITIGVGNNTITVSCSKDAKRKERALAGTFAAHCKSMIKGVTQGYTYTMKTVFSHFPIKTKVEGNTFLIQNFLGERAPRKAVILDGVDVKVDGEIVTVTGVDKECIGQTVANIERASKVKKRDIRVFQDGVYLISKGG